MHGVVFAEADDLADHFERHHRAKHAGQRAENAGFRAGRHGACRRRLRKQAAIGRVARAVGACLIGAKGGERAVEGTDCRRHQRFFPKITGVGHQIAGGEIIRAVGNDVVFRDQAKRVVGLEPSHVGFDLNMRIEFCDRRLGGVHFALADIGGRENHLPLQIRQRHDVVVDHADVACAGRREIKQHRRAQAAGADHQHARGFQLGLPWAANLAQHDVARIAFEFSCIEHEINPMASHAFLPAPGRLRARFDGLRCRKTRSGWR